MIIAATYSLNGGKELIENRYSPELAEIKQIIDSVRAEDHRTASRKVMGRSSGYKSGSLVSALKDEFMTKGWLSQRVKCEYPAQYYVGGYVPDNEETDVYRELDSVKNRLGIEIAISYPIDAYNACAKMTIFHNLGIIDAGVEVVPVKAFANNMSTGVSYFEQFVWDLNQRGVADIDIPVLILGIAGD